MAVAALYPAPARTKMRRIDINERNVRKLAYRSGAYLDISMRGYMVICNATSKSYVFQRDVDGRAVRITLGRYGEIAADAARILATKALLQMQEGRNPNREKREARVRGMTLSEAFDLFKSSGHEWSPKTLEEYEGIYTRYLKHWANRTMLEIGEDRTGVNKLHRAIYERVVKGGRKRKRDIKNPEARPGTYAANRALELLRNIYNRARRQVTALPTCPTENVDFFPRRQRDDSLRTEDLKPWFEKMTRVCSGVKRDYYISVVLTGGRRNQIAEARWEHIDFQKGTWLFPKPKGGKERAYKIPVSQYLLCVLKRRKEDNELVASGSPWVFPSDRKVGSHIEKPRDEKKGLPLPHALRHTYKTHSVIAGIREVESHLLMNHALGGANAGYITREVTLDGHLRPAQERITEYFLRQFGSGSGVTENSLDVEK